MTGWYTVVVRRGHRSGGRADTIGADGTVGAALLLAVLAALVALRFRRADPRGEVAARSPS
ncbi:MAG: hypothetical protein ABI990_00625 [Actinomycetota bacterium]